MASSSPKRGRVKKPAEDKDLMEKLIAFVAFARDIAWEDGKKGKSEFQVSNKFCAERLFAIVQKEIEKAFAIQLEQSRERIRGQALAADSIEKR